MKKLQSRLVALISIAVALAGASAFGQKTTKVKSYRGEIMDNMCAAAGSHKGMAEMFHIPGDDPRKCTLECVAKGGKFVLYDAATKTVYQLDDQKKPKAFAGRKVKVSGTFDSKTGTIHVGKIVPAS